jgi:hypothetical protein
MALTEAIASRPNPVFMVSPAFLLGDEPERAIPSTTMPAATAELPDGRHRHKRRQRTLPAIIGASTPVRLAQWRVDPAHAFVVRITKS